MSDARQRIRDAVDALLLDVALSDRKLTFVKAKPVPKSLAGTEAKQGTILNVRMIPHKRFEGFTAMLYASLRTEDYGRLLPEGDERSVSEYVEGLLAERGLVKLHGHWFFPGSDIPEEMRVTRGGVTPTKVAG